MDTNRRGRSLDPDFVLEAYTVGFFPMADPADGEISWYSPDPRAVLPIKDVHVSTSLRRYLNRGELHFQLDTAFGEVIRACGDRNETWISPEITRVYEALHGAGHAHSVEAWRGSELVGGLYGVSIGGAFFGESMFSRTPNASKAALVFLAGLLQEHRFRLHDVQFMTSHLAGFGALEMPRKTYLNLLSRALRAQVTFPRRSL